jgi:metal-responsive CopG/Arc/MetJ family transcriptional regulator
MRQIAVSLDEGCIKELDGIRGLVARSAYLRQLIINKIEDVTRNEQSCV